jgi:predicted RNA-binding protein YlqC (UPF0109 family)
MKEMLILMAKRLVDNPDAVDVVEENRDGMVVLRLVVAPDDMGKVIGKQGRIARALRTLVKAAAINEKKMVNVEIM